MPLSRPPSCMSSQLRQDSNLRLSRTGLLHMSESNMIDKDKDRCTKGTTETEIKQIQKQDSNLRLNRAVLHGMNEFLMKDENETREKTNLLSNKNDPYKRNNHSVVYCCMFVGEA